MSMKIGLYDSGLGGLTILRAILDVLPEYDYLYYGDTAALPLGDKTEEEIYALTKIGVQHLFERGCILVIIACNTASAETLRKLQDGFLANEYPDRKILGVIVPTIEQMLASDAKRALLIATKRTVQSGKYEKELRLKGSRPIILNKIAVPELVGHIEAGEIERAEQKAVEIIDTHSITGDVIVLGCTHYSLLKERLRKHYAGQHQFVSQDEVVPLRLVEYLRRHSEIASRLSKNASHEVYLTEPRLTYKTFLEALR